MASSSTVPGGAREAKAALRKEMKAKIKALPMEDRSKQSKIVTEKLLAMSEFKESKSVSLYLNMPDEIQTETILIECLK